ncbi:hypothetical protein Tco_0547629 [Tanacetum coccineum]
MHISNHQYIVNGLQLYSVVVGDYVTGCLEDGMYDAEKKTLTVQQKSNDISEVLKDIAREPHFKVYTCKGYLINGYKFHTRKHSEGKVNKLSGVCVRGSVSNGYECDYYGTLDYIIDVKLSYRYPGLTNGGVVLFMCQWFDTPGGVGVKRKNN